MKTPRPRPLGGVVEQGKLVAIPALAIEYFEGGHTIWVQGRDGTILRIKTLDGVITTELCQTSPIAHGDITVHDNIKICHPGDF